MLSPSDYNSAVPQFTNGNYAANPINPLYIEEPGSTEYNRGVEPLQTLPAQWWNWFANQFTLRFNKLNIYVKNIFNELTQLLSLMNITPDGTEGTPTIAQLKGAFQTEYPKYMALLMYPVGSLYWTGKAPDDGGDPNVLFGGTWVQIKGKFIFAKGDSDTLNDTGGAKTVTLIEDNLPSHRHDYTPSGSISITSNPSFSGTTGTVSVSGGDHNHGQALSTGTTGNTNTILATTYGNYGYIVSYCFNSGSLSMSGSFTPSGSVSGGAYKFTGTSSYTGNIGSGTAVDKMPPYVVKYCWERTA